MSKVILIVLPAKQLTLDADPRGFGGIYKAALTQVQALKSAGATVVVLTASLPFAKQAEAEGAICFYHPRWHHSLFPMLSLKCWLQARRINQLAPAAALQHSGRSWPWAKAMFPRIPNVGILHTASLRRTRHFKYQMALSTANLQSLSSDPANSKYRFGLIKNGLFQKPEAQVLTAPESRREDAATAGPAALRLGYLGRVCHSKGIDILLQAAAILKRRGLPVTLKIVGESSGEFIDQATQLDVADLTSFDGWTDNPDAFYAEIDVFCLASRIEPFGLVVLEAMAMGLPVIASRCEGPRDIIEDGKSGILFDSENAQQLADAIERLHRNPELRRQLGDQSRRHVAEHYSPGTIGRSILTEIDTLLGSS